MDIIRLKKQTVLYLGVAAVCIFMPAACFAQSVIQWPVNFADPMAEVQSFFGPRLVGCSTLGCYDFHRGIDIAGSSSDEVVAAAAGTVIYRYEENEDGSPFTNGGNVVVLKHVLEEGFLFHGEKHSTIYTYYLHLDRIEESIEVGDEVSSEQQIGYIGKSGTATTEHLHFETRIGETCSLALSCNKNGFDPHVSPLSLLLYAQDDEIKVDIRKRKKAVRVQVTMPQDEFDVNRMQVRALNKNKRPIRTRKLNFNTRKGVDASTTMALDTPLYRKIRIEPQSISSSSDTHTMTIAFRKMLTKNTKYIRVNVRDAKRELIYKKTVKMKLSKSPQ